MNELINAVRNVMKLVSGEWLLELGVAQVEVTSQLEPLRSHAHLGNGVRWSDIVADIESAGVSPSIR